MTCKGVGEESVQINGQICREVQLTGTHLEVFQLPLLVIKELLILGIDFWLGLER